MERFLLLRDGQNRGELLAEREGLYTRFSARGRIPEGEELWCVWLIGERGERKLGVLEPDGEWGCVCRRFSGGELAPLGCVLRGELRRVGEERPVWEKAAEPSGLFQAPWLRERLQGLQGGLTRQDGERRMLALPWDKRRPFPLEPLFCLATLQCIGNRYYVVYAFDREERPVIPEEKM